MSFWRLSSPDTFTELALASQHIAWLCALAFLVAVFSASVLLTVMQRYHHSVGQARGWWLAAGSIVMGTGIWAMHFTGMLAFSLPVPVSYNWTNTLASILPAIAASGAFQALYRTRELSQARMITISLVMAVGIGTMHYVGMEAVVVPADMYYEPGLFLLSILAAVALAYCAVLAQSRLATVKWFSQWQSKVIGSITLGLAVTLMHFIAMSATYFQPNESTVIGAFKNAPISLVIEVMAISAVLFLVATISTVVDRRMEDMSARLHNSEARFQSLAESTQTAIFTLTAERITYANPALCRMTHLSLAELYSRSLEEILDYEFREDIARLLESEAESESIVHQEIRIHDLDDKEKWLFCSLTRQEIDATPVALASAFDIIDQKSAAIKMQHLAYSDHLTNLHNRMVLMDRLQHYLDSMARNDSTNTACVMIVDLDGFKQINESLGHVQGDKLLITVGKRLQKLARSTDTMSRFGGDEFVLLFEQIANSLDIDAIAERVLDSVSGQVKLNRWVVSVSASIGIVEVTQQYKSPDEVLHDADIALSRAKELGNGGWVLFDEELDSAAKRKRMLLPQLKRAIELRKLQMYFQPICNSSNGAVRGFEALARWTMVNSLVPANLSRWQKRLD